MFSVENKTFFPGSNFPPENKPLPQQQPAMHANDDKYYFIYRRGILTSNCSFCGFAIFIEKKSDKLIGIGNKTLVLDDKDRNRRV